MRIQTLFVFAVLVLSTADAVAQAPPLKLPEASPAASVTQMIGLTEAKVTYHRPGVGGRKVWGELVPYGDVWRAGANENTVVSFSTPVKIAGKALPAGTYGLHVIPTPKDWTVIFSKVSNAWGSYSYDPKEDALRVTIPPLPSETFTERLSYSFDNPSETSATLAMRWETVRLPISIDVDTPKVVMANMRGELRGLARFFWLGWNQAAQYWLKNGDLDEALKLSDKSLELGENFQNVMTRSAIVEKKGDVKAAAAQRAKALALATENDLNLYAYGLLAEKKADEALAIFRKNAEDHPGSWNAHDSLGEAYATKGDKKAAAESYTKALSLVKDPGNKKRIEQVLNKLKAK
jgi:hypothetical protein